MIERRLLAFDVPVLNSDGVVSLLFLFRSLLTSRCLRGERQVHDRKSSETVLLSGAISR